MSFVDDSMAMAFDFGRSKERRKPLFSREIAVLIYAILAVSIIVCGYAMYDVQQSLKFEEVRANPSEEAIDRLTKTRNTLAALLAVESLTVAIGVADYFM